MQKILVIDDEEIFREKLFWVIEMTLQTYFPAAPRGDPAVTVPW